MVAVDKLNGRMVEMVSLLKAASFDAGSLLGPESVNPNPHAWMLAACWAFLACRPGATTKRCVSKAAICKSAQG